MSKLHLESLNLLGRHMPKEIRMINPYSTPTPKFTNESDEESILKSIKKELN